MQIVISVPVNALIAISTGSIVLFLMERPEWAVAQRWLMGTGLSALAIRMATEVRR